MEPDTLRILNNIGVVVTGAGVKLKRHKIFTIAELEAIHETLIWSAESIEKLVTQVVEDSQQKHGVI